MDSVGDGGDEDGLVFETSSGERSGEGLQTFCPMQEALGSGVGQSI